MDDKDIAVEQLYAGDNFKDYFPASFGNQTQKSNLSAQVEKTRRIPAKPKKQDSESNSDSDSESDEDDEFPVSHELVFKTHDRAVTSISVDNSGARFITGSTDCTVKLHDFASMTPTTLRAFKSVDPFATKESEAAESHPIHHVEFNPISPIHILLIAATSQPLVFSRDGEKIAECGKGDMYLRDLHNTKGHIAEVTSGAWHPTDRNAFASSGADSSIRIWDVNNTRKQNQVLVHKSKMAGAGGRTKMTAIKWGTALVGAALDGSLLMWGGNGPWHRPTAEVEKAHEPNAWISGLDISSDGRLIVSYGEDDTIKRKCLSFRKIDVLIVIVWDTRKFKIPIRSVTHKSTSAQFSSSNIIFSGSNILVGSATGDLHILNSALKPELVTPVTPGVPLITVEWHSKLDQILTGSANGETRVLYNPEKSTKGAVLIMSKTPKRRHIDDDPSFTTDIAQGIAGDSIIANGQTMSAMTAAVRHPTIGLTHSGKSRDPRRPHVPQNTPWGNKNPDERHVRESYPLSSMRDEDPRAALLKYAEVAKNDPMFTKAWQETQPETIYAERSDDEERDKKKARR
jgi:WD40 repeat protein